MIRIEHLCKEYENIVPLKDVTTTINKGDVIAVIGPSGAGKSTFIRCLNMLEKPTSGRIYVNNICITEKGCNINKIRQKMGMVFQSFNLFSHMTVIENIMAAPVDLLKKTPLEARQKAMELLEQVGLLSRANSFPDELSGGQKQRVAIARALAMEPEILLFDEPTSALDPTMISEVTMVIKDLAKRGLTMIIVTHEIHFAKEVSNRVFYMDDGGIYEDGTPEQIFDNPKRNRTRQFINQMQVVYERIDNTTDLLGLSTKIESFGQSHYMERQKINSAIAILRTLYNEILKNQNNISHFHYMLEYSERESVTNVTILVQNNMVNCDILSNELNGHFENLEFEPGDKNDTIRFSL